MRFREPSTGVAPDGSVKLRAEDDADKCQERLTNSRLFRGPVIVGSPFAIYKASAHRPHELGLATVLLQPPAPISGPRIVPSEEFEKYLRCPPDPQTCWPLLRRSMTSPSSRSIQWQPPFARSRRSTNH